MRQEVAEGRRARKIHAKIAGPRVCPARPVASENAKGVPCWPLAPPSRAFCKRAAAPSPPFFFAPKARLRPLCGRFMGFAPKAPNSKKQKRLQICAAHDVRLGCDTMSPKRVRLRHGFNTAFKRLQIPAAHDVRPVRVRMTQCARSARGRSRPEREKSRPPYRGE